MDMKDVLANYTIQLHLVKVCLLIVIWMVHIDGANITLYCKNVLMYSEMHVVECDRRALLVF